MSATCACRDAGLPKESPEARSMHSGSYAHGCSCPVEQNVVQDSGWSTSCRSCDGSEEHRHTCSMNFDLAGDHVAVPAVPAVAAALDVVDHHAIVDLEAPAVWPDL